MAFQKMNTVTKLNKGTSRNQWGDLNYWGYKAPDGLIRARVYPPNSDGIAKMAVKQFVKQPNTWRRRVEFDHATDIGTIHVKVDDTDKGFTSKEATEIVNAVIEIHNELYEKHVGRKVARTNTSSSRRAESLEVEGVHFFVNAVDEQTVTLSGQTVRWTASEDGVVDYTDDLAKEKFAGRMSELRAEVDAATRFLDSVEAAFEAGKPANRTNPRSDHWQAEGLIQYNTVTELLNLANALHTEAEIEQARLDAIKSLEEAEAEALAIAEAEARAEMAGAI